MSHWLLTRGDQPLVATAIHDGHEVRDELVPLLALGDAERLREEDPFTGLWAEVAETRVIARRSRFEVDLNRPRETAVYREPADAWGLKVWKQPLPDDVLERSRAEYDAFYAMLAELYQGLVERHGRFVVFDLHSYNHRRDGPDGPVADPAGNPQVNIGTGTLADRERWSGLIERFIGDLSGFDFPGGRLDVRENVKFRGGQCARWTHETFGSAACVISIELKKFFMDEWSGQADNNLLRAVTAALRSTLPGVLGELSRP